MNGEIPSHVKVSLNLEFSSHYVIDQSMIINFWYKENIRRWSPTKYQEFSFDTNKS